MNITFKRIAPHESRIYDDDGDCIGEVYRQDDILNPGHPVYVAWLDEDPRGSLLIRDRARIRELVIERALTHPYW